MINDEEYIDINELCSRIKDKKQTIYNRIHRKEYILGKHYLKPNKKKLIFKWSEIQNWLGEKQVDTSQKIFSHENQTGQSTKENKKKYSKNLIKI